MSAPIAPAPLPGDVSPEALLRTLLATSPTGILLLRPVYAAADAATIVDFTYAQLNPAAQQLLGLPEYPAESFLTRYPAARLAGPFSFYCAAFWSGQAERHQQLYQHDGLDGYYQLVAQRQGPLLVVHFTDTNDQPRSAVEAALRESQAREQAALAEAEVQRANLTRVFQQAPAAICVLAGPELTFELVNPLHQRLFPGRVLLGRPLREAMPDLWDHEGGRILRQVYATGMTHESPEIMVPMSRVENGPVEDIYFRNVSQPRFNAEGQVDGVLLFTFDTTEQVKGRQQVEQLNQELETRVQARTHELHAQQALLAAVNQELLGSNQALQQSNQRLSRTNADLDTFVYTASHDLKSPITNLEGLLAVLRDTLPVDVQQQPLIGPLLGLLDSTVSRFRLTIEQLTELIRLQQTPAGPAQPVQLEPLVAAVLEDLGAEATAAQAQLAVAIPEGLCISFAPANLRSIVYNLLSNALKYRDPTRPAQVWVRAERQPTAVVLTVQDNGLGLSESQQQRLFQAFERLHTHVAGTGVGLYMIKRLIENAGATIAVTSALGVGSTFTVTFAA